VARLSTAGTGRPGDEEHTLEDDTLPL
jgi:hypothetical protein